MPPKLILTLAVFPALAVAQVQLRFAPQAFANYEPQSTAYVRIVPLPDSSILVLQSSVISAAIGLSESQHSQLSVANLGAGQLQTGSPPLGGSGNDVPQAVAVDSSGNTWIVGNTDSDDFPLVNPIIAQKVPYRPVGFVLELDPTLTKILFSTYLGGQQRSTGCQFCRYFSSASAIAIDGAGNAYIGGTTDETDFPATPGAFLSKGAGASNFGDTFFYSFLVKISPADKLIYSTLLHTGGNDCFGGSRCIGKQSTSGSIVDLAADADGTVTTAEVMRGYYAHSAGFISHVAADGSKILWSAGVGGTYGGVSNLAMGRDSSGSVNLFGRYVTKVTLIPGDPQTDGTPGLFATKLNSDGSSVIYSTDLGQSPDAHAGGIALDASGNPYLSGTSSSAQFPSLPGTPNLGADFVLRLDASGAKPQTLFRLPRGTVNAPPVFNSDGRIVVLGSQGSLLALPPAYAFDTPAIVGFSNAASYAMNIGLWPGELVSLYGFDLAANAQEVKVLINGQPAAVLYAGSTQINVQVPFELSVSPYETAPQVQLLLASGSFSFEPRVAQSIGIFTFDGVHAAALNQDGTVNSPSNPAAGGSVVTLFGTGATWPNGIQDGSIATAMEPIQRNLEVVDGTGVPASIVYSGAAPGMIYGVFQLNVQLPPDNFLPLTLQTIGPVGPTLASNSVQVYQK